MSARVLDLVNHTIPSRLKPALFFSFFFIISTAFLLLFFYLVLFYGPSVWTINMLSPHNCHSFFFPSCQQFFFYHSRSYLLLLYGPSAWAINILSPHNCDSFFFHVNSFSFIILLSSLIVWPIVLDNKYIKSTQLSFIFF